MPITGTICSSTRTDTVTFIELSSGRRACMAPELVAVDGEDHLAAVDDIAGDDVEALAGGAVHEFAACSRCRFCSIGRRHLLGEHADAAAAVERHADLAGRRRAGEIAGEFGALVLAGDDLARAGPLPSTDLKNACRARLPNGSPASADGG